MFFLKLIFWYFWDRLIRVGYCFWVNIVVVRLIFEFIWFVYFLRNDEFDDDVFSKNDEILLLLMNFGS